MYTLYRDSNCGGLVFGYIVNKNIVDDTHLPEQGRTGCHCEEFLRHEYESYGRMVRNYVFNHEFHLGPSHIYGYQRYEVVLSSITRGSVKAGAFLLNLQELNLAERYSLLIG